MNEPHRSKKTDLVLSNGEYAFTQDTTTGVVKVLTGPTVVNVTGQEYPVVYASDDQRFAEVDLENAAQMSPMASQGFYIELHNPPATETGSQPSEGSKEIAPALLMGRRVNLPGPVTFSLWPRQVAKVIEGHHLRSNQYLLGRVYDEEAAKENWKKAVLKIVSSAEEALTEGPQGTISELTEDDLSVGKLFVIKGTEVSFYIPPTGVEVVPDEHGRFARDALTLERLQYCILVDENGDKDYQRGPKVVFPKPTQRFYADPKSGDRIFRPTELNQKQGILVKVIAAYEEDGQRYGEGDELFITGADTPIYIPRPEHSLIRYDGNAKHFATAVPVGEARYVMQRNTGVIRMVRGPTMLLPDPREEVIVRRVLEDEECSLWYPLNEEARRYNRQLQTLSRGTPSTRAAVSEGEVKRKGKTGRRRSAPGSELGIADVSTVHSAKSGPVADEWLRAATFNEPRTLTLATKYSGVPTLRVWSGYAVMVVGKSGARRVETGPKTLLLDYDESLEVLSLSTGLAKTAAQREETVYLKLSGNRVCDRVLVRTKNHVSVSVQLALHVDFEGEEPTRWFAVDDFVGLATARVRRRLSELVRSMPIDALHGDPAAIVREAILGPPDEDGVRAGMLFATNAMRITDVEVSELKIEDEQIAKLFSEARVAAISSAVELDQVGARLAIARERLALQRAQLEAEAENERFVAALQKATIERELDLALSRAEASIGELDKKRAEQQAMDAIADSRQAAALARQARSSETTLVAQREELAIEVQRIGAVTAAAVSRFEAAQGPLAEAITMLGNQQVLAKVAEAVSAQRLFGGKNVADVVGTLFEGTRLAGVFDAVQRGAVMGDAEE